jgi:ubiquinone/menaquinone biosynthesis C-methylase UbiE
MDDGIRRALLPSEDEIRAMPIGANTKFAAELIGTANARALDIGCGEGKFTRGLKALCKDVAGVDVKERSIDKAKAAAQAEGVDVDFRVASGQALPWKDGEFDVVVFSNSLHHMPNVADALNEAGRVLKSGGLLYVMEPVASGNYHEATRLVNDETIVRMEALRALHKLVGNGFEQAREIMYRSTRSFDNFDEWKADQIDRDEKRRAKFDADPQKVRSTFEGQARREDGKLVFDQVFRVDLLRKG